MVPSQVNFYNENDPKAAAWLRELIKAGLIPDGQVDERSIAKIQPADVRGFFQCHWFCGVGGWPLAFDIAGFHEHCWSGSCPCQPFSQAGKGRGIEDERHLWPEFRRLISECRPSVVIGEQVASAAGRAWLSGVRADLEGMAYAVGGTDLCAASAGQKNHPRIVEAADRFRWQATYWRNRGDDRRAGECAAIAEWLSGVIVGAPHIRQRIYWVAQPQQAERRTQHPQHAEACGRNGSGGRGDAGRMADAAGDGCRQERAHGTGRAERGNTEVRTAGPGLRGAAIRLGDSDRERLRGPGTATGADDDRQTTERRQGDGSPERVHEDCACGLAVSDGRESSNGELQRSGEHGQQPVNGRSGFWAAFDIVHCTDNKARRIERASEPLATGFPADMVRCGGESAPGDEAGEADRSSGRETFPLTTHQEARMMRLRGYGNAICVPLAAEFIRAFMETRR